MTPASAKRVLQERQLTPKRHFGQNFLCQPDFSERIAELLVKKPGGSVIEIGAGLGALTRPLLRRAQRVIAIERDRDLIPILRESFEDSIASGSLSIVEADAKTTDYADLLQGAPEPHRVTGNLPYQLTGPLLRRAMEYAPLIERAVFMLQLEVAERLCAAPGESAYGALSVFVRSRYAVERSFTVSRTAFYPQPKVDSAVVEMTPLGHAAVGEPPLFRDLVRSAFQQRRKKLSNAWSAVASTASLTGAAARAGIDLDLRGEVLSVADFVRMAEELAR